MGAIFGFVDVNAPLYGAGSLGAKPSTYIRSAANSDSRDN